MKLSNSIAYEIINSWQKKYAGNNNPNIDKKKLVSRLLEICKDIPERIVLKTNHLWINNKKTCPTLSLFHDACIKVMDKEAISFASGDISSFAIPYDRAQEKNRQWRSKALKEIQAGLSSYQKLKMIDRYMSNNDVRFKNGLHEYLIFSEKNWVEITPLEN